jgi:hypothetical protein
MDFLGWSFSSSRVQRSVFSRNAYLALSLKPRNDRMNNIGHDGTEFKAWEILGLQNYLLSEIDNMYVKYVSEDQKEQLDIMNKMIENLHVVYDFNALFTKKGKGELWIKYFTYLQDAIGISSYYDLYVNRHERLLENIEKDKNYRLTQISTVLSGLIFATIFITIAIFLVGDGGTDCSTFISKTYGSNFGNIFVWSTFSTTIISVISIISMYRVMQFIINKIKWKI